MAAPEGHWLLIAVLQSTLPLESAVAIRIYQAALELHRESGSVQRLHGDLASGQVRRLGKTMVLGAIGGPAFEAELDTPRGSGLVRFVITPAGLREDEPDVMPRSSLPN